jgi:hypothetical protein
LRDFRFWSRLAFCLLSLIFTSTLFEPGGFYTTDHIKQNKIRSKKLFELLEDHSKYSIQIFLWHPKEEVLVVVHYWEKRSISCWVQ